MEGWFKLHRSIIDSAVFDDSDVLKVWIWLLCNVAYYDHDVVYYGKIYEIKSGQIITGRQKMASQIRMSESKVYRALNILKLLGNIDIKSNNRFSLINIVNWAKYQSETAKINIEITANQQQNEQQNNSKTDSTATAQQQPNNTTKEYKESKEIKEIKNIKKESKTSYDTILAKIQDDGLKELYLEYIKMRKMIKSPMTDKALQMLISKVEKLEPTSVERQKLLIETAILNNWKSVYPIKEETKQTAAMSEKERSFDLDEFDNFSLNQYYKKEGE